MAHQAIRRQANGLRIAHDFFAVLSPEFGIFLKRSVFLKTFQSAPFEIVGLILGVARRKGRSVKGHFLGVRVMLCDAPGNDNRNLLQMFKVFVGDDKGKVIGKPTASGVGHPCNLANFIAECLLLLLIYAMLGDPETRRGGNDQGKNDGGDNFSGELGTS